ncbi:hypothetical protein [Crossiella sp. NPDC003009]
MTGPWRQRLSATERAELDQWWATMLASDPPTELELEEASRRNSLETRRFYDRSATLEEELQVRLYGPHIEGELPFDLGQELFRPLRDSVNSTSRAKVHLALAGVTSGSTILRIRATAPEAKDSEFALLPPRAASAPDHAVRKLLDFIGLAENEGDLRAWPAALRSTLPKLADVLFTHSLIAEFTWLASTGTIRRTRLSSRGQAFIRRLREYTEQKRTTEVVGLVSELRQAGWIVVSPAKGADIHVHIEQGALATLRLTLWQQVRLEVEVTVHTNRFGDKTNAHYQYRRLLHIPTDS